MLPSTSKWLEVLTYLKLTRPDLHIQLGNLADSWRLQDNLIYSYKKDTNFVKVSQDNGVSCKRRGTNLIVFSYSNWEGDVEERELHGLLFI